MNRFVRGQCVSVLVDLVAVTSNGTRYLTHDEQQELTDAYLAQIAKASGRVTSTFVSIIAPKEGDTLPRQCLTFVVEGAGGNSDD